MSLFRLDVIRHQQQKLHGHILLARPLSFAFYAWFSVAISTVIVLFFVCASFTRKEVVPGVLMPAQGLIRIFAGQGGILLGSNVQEGQMVAAEQDLFVVSGERTSSECGDTHRAVGATLQLRIERLKSELRDQAMQTQQQHAAIERKRAELGGQITQIDAEITLQRSRLQLAEQAAERLAALQSANFISLAQVQDKTAEKLDQSARLQALLRSKASIVAEQSAADADLVDQPLRAQREASAIQRTIAELEQGVAENEALRRSIVRAPMAGTVTAVANEIGQSVNANSPLAALIPANAQLEAQLYASSRAIGFIKPGARVLIRYQAFPYQKFGQFGGTVREVSRTAVAAQELAMGLANNPSPNEPLFKIRVVLDETAVQAYGTRQALKSGMQLEASILLEKRKLYEWIIEPLLSVAGRV
jgi:membrane fusion protein